MRTAWKMQSRQANLPERSLLLRRQPSARDQLLTHDPIREEKTSRALRFLGIAVVPLLAFVLFSGGLSATRNEPASQTPGTTNHPPFVKTASILPSPLVLSGPVSVRVEAQDLDQQTVVFRYRWLVNGQVMSGQTESALPAQLLKRGDHVAVEIIPFDGVIEGAPFRSLPVTVVNTAPMISNVEVDLDHGVQGRRLVAKVNAVDPDHDSVTLMYRWRKNDTILKEGDDSTLDVSDLTAKDTIQLELTALDGRPDGSTTVSQQFTLTNSFPAIVSSPAASPRGDVYEYLVRASDPDGDPLTYALEVSPPGMTIEAETGHIHWLITPEIKGIYHVRVIAKDPHGGFATQDFDLSLRTHSS